MTSATAGPAPKLTSYQRRLMIFLSVATFFEGFDFFALAQILPNLRADFGLTETEGGMLVSAINGGAILAYFPVRKADRVGRKPILSITIAGYTLCTLAAGLAPNVWVFAVAQVLGRIFLIGEWAIAMVFAAEEYPAEKRGLAIGIIQAFSSLGGVVCAGVVPMLLKTGPGWRSVFFVGAVPLVAVAFARRSIRETERFRTRPATAETSLFRIWSTPWRGRVVLLAVIWGLTYTCTSVAVLYWKESAVHERAFTEAMVGKAVAIAALAAMPMVFLSGKLLDKLGRRLGATLIYTTTIAGGAGAFLLHGTWPLTVALVFAMFGVSAVLPVLNAFTTELFPTEMRSDGFAWANNLLGRLTSVASPLVVSVVAANTGWGTAVALTAFGPVLALVLILLTMPETRGRELEDTSALAH